MTEARLPKTTVFRVLSSLVERGYCECDPQTGKYSLGFELLRLADIRRRQTNVHDVAAPAMREIRNAVNETVILSVRAGDSRVHVDFVEGLHAMRRMADLGVPAPLYAGAASKVLLAGMEDEEIEAYLDRTDLTAFQDSTITDRALLWREVRSIRKRGFAESKGELFAGGGALAAPIKDFSGKTIAVLDILTPEHRYTEEHRERCIAILLEGTHAPRRGSAIARRCRSRQPGRSRRLDGSAADQADEPGKVVLHSIVAMRPTTSSMSRGESTTAARRRNFCSISPAPSG